MKSLKIVLSSVALASIVLMSPAAKADSCQSQLQQDAKSAAKDKECRKDATNLFRALGKQIKTCKAHRKALKACRKAKRSAVKDCRKLKGAAERKCKKQARAVKRACKDEARQQSAFAVCKSARLLTARSAGTALKCAAKHFKKSAQTCASQLAN
ncbi:MAG: hypothetical protein H6728_11550 [Myxococcales bacterium]|nr:hypothetical protein [Myxococcales bacterium]MCB9643698.1 hypothetical protein [Myxococcales bacterium]